MLLFQTSHTFSNWATVTDIVSEKKWTMAGEIDIGDKCWKQNILVGEKAVLSTELNIKVGYQLLVTNISTPYGMVHTQFNNITVSNNESTIIL